MCLSLEVSMGSPLSWLLKGLFGYSYYPPQMPWSLGKGMSGCSATAWRPWALEGVRGAAAGRCLGSVGWKVLPDSTKSSWGTWIFWPCYREHTQRALEEAKFPFPHEGSQQDSKAPSEIISFKSFWQRAGVLPCTLYFHPPEFPINLTFSPTSDPWHRWESSSPTIL